MAANYFYPLGHGGAQFSLSSGSYPGGGYSGSRAQQPASSEQHSQMHNAFANQLEQNAANGENKTYLLSTSSTSIPSYSLSTGNAERRDSESKYLARFQPQASSQNSDRSSYLSGMTSKSLYSSSNANEWDSAGVSGSNSGHGFPVSDGSESTRSYAVGGCGSSPFTTEYVQSWNNNASSGQRPCPFLLRPRARQPPKPTQLHYCEICRISCAGSQTYTEHLEGKNHKKKEAQSKAAESSRAKSSYGSGVRQLYCQLCDIVCTGTDTYAAHIRGTRHQKVLNLHAKLGKPIPDVLPADGIAARSEGLAAGIKKVPPSKLNFVDGSQMSTASNIDECATLENVEGTSATNREVEGQDDEADVQPVGLEYIEESRNETGNAISFRCKLCECNFTDPLAKVMHSKGRRHRLNYKQKVDPTLPVSMKPSSSQKYWQMNRQAMKSRRNRDAYWKQRHYNDPYRQEVEELRFEKEYLQWQLSHALERYDWLAGPYSMSSDPPPLMLTSICNQSLETQDDQLVKAKHASLYPTEEDLAAVQRTVSDCESTLKFVSDLLASASASAEQNSEPVATDSANVKLEAGDDSVTTPASAPSASRQLKAVVRVGALSKGLLLHDHLNLELIVLCNSWPTHGLLNRVLEEFTKQLNVTAPDKYAVSLSPEGVNLVVTSLTEPKTTCTISLTSLVVRGESAHEPETDDLIDREKCLESLAALRHAKWFQGKASGLFSCVILVRILKDICNRIPSWNPLPHWALELLVEKCLSSCEEPVQPGEGLQRILECISSGLFLSGGTGLYDPCEKEPTDALESLTSQQREDITFSAQNALRLLAFGQVHKVLDMEPLSSTGLPAHRRKRQRAADGQAQRKNVDSGHQNN